MYQAILLVIYSITKFKHIDKYVHIRIIVCDDVIEGTKFGNKN